MTTATVTAPVCHNFINERWVESHSGKSMERGNPPDPREEVRDAIATAKIAFPECRDMPARSETGITHVNAPTVASEAQTPLGGTKATGDYTSRPA